MSDAPSLRARFDRLLASYQKICLFLLFPPLISAFSCVVGMFNSNYALTLSMSVILGIRPLFSDGLVAMLLSFAILAVFVPLALFSAKGKFYLFWIGVGLYLADFGYTFFLLSGLTPLGIGLNIAVHVIFLGAYAFGAAFYIRADKLLKAHPKEILG